MSTGPHPGLWIRRGLLAALVLAASAAPLRAQGYRLRIDSRVQRAGFRGYALDSILASATVTNPQTGGSETPDGFAVSCPGITGYCFFYRPRARQLAAPGVTTADLTLWGFGVTGLRVRANARLAYDLGDANVWPGTDPALQLEELYAEYAPRDWLTGRLGRQIYAGRLGWTGFDGGRVTLRENRRGLELGGYLGWGLARAVALPVSSSVLNPLDEYQPRQRQLVAGAVAGWNNPRFDANLEYQRQVDQRNDYFVSERAALSADIHPLPHWSLVAGAEYNIAEGLWGSADATLRYLTNAWTATVGARRYRPYFELWTIWGAFSPVAYKAVNASATVSIRSNLSLRARGERYWYDDAEVSTPLVTVEDRGWRVGLGATWSPRDNLSLEVGHESEYGPGGAYNSYDAGVSYQPREQLGLTAWAARLTRPLELRVNEARVNALGLNADWRPAERWQFSLGGAWYKEDRRRPDAAALDWNQTRLTARVSFFMSSGADMRSLPPARRTDRPEGAQ